MRLIARKFRTAWLCSVAAVGSSLACAGCASMVLTGDGARVAAIFYAPGGCQSLGIVTVQAPGSAASSLSDEELMRYGMSYLRNKAAALGATHVHVIRPQLGPPGGDRSQARMSGTAYRCPRRYAK